MPEKIHHEAVKAGNSAVVTGGASGIGLAAAQRFAQAGMNVLIADRDQEGLEAGLQSLRRAASGSGEVHSMLCDVSQEDQVRGLADFAFGKFSGVSVLMNNAGAAIMDAGKPWENVARWRKQLEVNLWGVIYGVQAFVPAMIEQGGAGAVINTGSKQGITRPPGNAAYNLSKAGVIAFTESLAHELRQLKDCRLSAHLLVPGLTYTGMIARFLPKKPPAAWTSEQVADFMLERLGRGDFYILCPDNDVSRAVDERRIRWHADDMIQNRPALSRWHEDYAEEFKRFMQSANR